VFFENVCGDDISGTISHYRLLYYLDSWIFLLLSSVCSLGEINSKSILVMWVYKSKKTSKQIGHFCDRSVILKINTVGCTFW